MNHKYDKYMNKIGKKGLESRVLARDAYVAHKGIKVHVVHMQREGGVYPINSNGDFIICVCKKGVLVLRKFSE